MRFFWQCQLPQCGDAVEVIHIDRLTITPVLSGGAQLRFWSTIDPALDIYAGAPEPEEPNRYRWIYELLLYRYEIPPWKLCLDAAGLEGELLYFDESIQAEMMVASGLRLTSSGPDGARSR